MDQRHAESEGNAMTDPSKTIKVHRHTAGALKTYLVVGIYRDNQQRYAEYVTAETPEEAEKITAKSAFDESDAELVVAAVFLKDRQGHLNLVG